MKELDNVGKGLRWYGDGGWKSFTFPPDAEKRNSGEVMKTPSPISI